MPDPTRSPLLCIDVSNQFIKAAVVRDGVWCEPLRIPTTIHDPAPLLTLLQPGEKIPVAFSSVVPSWTPLILRAFPNALAIRHDLALPFRLNYPAPASIGADRIANLATASGWAPVIVVDAGTAVTVDALDAAGVFHGGLIAPGLQTMAHALATHAALLPEIDLGLEKTLPAVPGISTQDAMKAGLIHGFVGSVSRLVDVTLAGIGSERPALLGTGGDALLLKKGGIGFDGVFPLLTLKGIARIANMNPGAA